MSYVVLARKYRPRQFSELIGQAHVSATLLNAFKQNKLGQAYLFTGTRGVGKTSAARIMAKALRCEDPDALPGGKNRGVPCGKCLSCQEIDNGTSIDVLEIDGASNNGVDNVREIRENVKFLPSRGSTKVYIIDEVHMLTGAAFNALLKTLEEPPAHVTFILATTEVQKIPATILSRCQRFDFKRVPPTVLFEYLLTLVQKEGIKAEPEALRIIARKGEGSMRDALSTLDQALALSGKKLSVEQVTAALGVVGGTFLTKLLGHILDREFIEAAKLIHTAFDGGVEMKQLALELSEQIRNALFVKLQAGDALLEISAEERQDLAKIVEKVSPETLQVCFRLLSQSLEEIIRSPFPRASLEMAVLRLTSLGELSSLQEIISKLQSGAGASPGTTIASSAAAATPVAKPTTFTTPTAPSTPAPSPVANHDINWQGFVDFVTQQKAAFGALLENAIPVTPLEQWKTSATISLGFRKNHSFYQMQLQGKANLEAMEKILLAYLGKKSTLKIESIDTPAEQAASMVEHAEKSLQEKVQQKKETFLKHDVVRNTEEIFGAQMSSFDIDKSKA